MFMNKEFPGVKSKKSKSSKEEVRDKKIDQILKPITNVVRHVLIIDKSGSMAEGTKWDDTISTFNENKQALEQIKGEHSEQIHYVSLITFNHIIEEVFENKGVEEIPVFSRKNYIPNGTTALYDAISSGISLAQKSFNDGDLVNIVVLSDGQNNRSETTKEAIVAKVDEMQSTGDWTFSFLNADLSQSTDDVRMNTGFANVVSSNLHDAGGKYFASSTLSYAAEVSNRNKMRMSNVSYSMNKKSLLNDDDFNKND